MRSPFSNDIMKSYTRMDCLLRHVTILQLIGTSVFEYSILVKVRKPGPSGGEALAQWISGIENTFCFTFVRLKKHIH